MADPTWPEVQAARAIIEALRDVGRRMVDAAGRVPVVVTVGLSRGAL